MLEFLADSIHLVAITPDGPLDGKWFGSDHAAAEAWALAENAASRNVYFTVNVTSPHVKIKPKKEHINAVRFAHVDIDPPAEGEWDKDSALLDLMARGAPSVIIDSGNGLQALWALVDGTPEVEDINRGIAHAFDADGSVHNIDRLFRVPGTTNFPDARKRARGRVETTASLLFEQPARYESATLAVHYPPPPRRTGAGSDEVAVGPYTILDPTDASPYLRSMLDAHPSDRSEHASRVAVQMGREGYSNEEIMGVLMNPAFHWQGTITDERQARRKISLAQDVRVLPEDMFPPMEDAPALIEPPARTRARQQGFQPHDGDVMHADQQIEYFKDCIYIKKFKVVIMPDGSESDHSQFDDTMGGQRFILTNDGKTTKSAWEALMRNERYKAPWVHNTCFRPEERPLTIIEEDGWKLVNTYMPINPPAIPGDPSPWLDHLCKLYPDDNDRKLLLSWMASCILNPGKKFQWWPVLIGAKGNAKTMILNIMEYCIGSRYTHLPNAGKMTRNGINFNGWIRGKLFLGVDEVYSANRRDFLEEFKPYVTNRRLPIESKGVDEFTGDNRANGIMTSNHWDGVPIDENERRYGVFFTAQQTYQDCVRDGLTSTYFSRLWAWLDRDGFAIINHYLRNYPLEAEYDPAQLSTRAPKTTSTSLAIAASLGSVEQEIEAAIEEGRAGFRGGWISSKALDSLFSEKGIKIARNKRINLVRALGYDLHPALHEGKTPSVVMPDGVRCRLYCLKESEEWEIAMPGAVAESYTGAQSGT